MLANTIHFMQTTSMSFKNFRQLSYNKTSSYISKSNTFKAEFTWSHIQYLYVTDHKSTTASLRPSNLVCLIETQKIRKLNVWMWSSQIQTVISLWRLFQTEETTQTTDYQDDNATAKEGGSTATQTTASASVPPVPKTTATPPGTSLERIQKAYFQVVCLSLSSCVSNHNDHMLIFSVTVSQLPQHSNVHTHIQRLVRHFSSYKVLPDTRSHSFSKN